MKGKIMKTGKSLVELATELMRVDASKRDYIVPTEQMHAAVVDNNVKLIFGDDKKFGLNNWSGSQLATYSDIPKNYFDRLLIESPGLAADNINHGLDRIVRKAKKEASSESRLVRTLDGNIRGLMSARYRILDGHDMLESVFPVLSDKGMQVVSSELTEKRLFLKAISPKLTAEVKKGDVVQYGLLVSTSDVGAGSVRVEPLIYRLACLNGLVMNTAIRKYHVGKNQAEDDIRELLSDKTRDMADSAFWASVRDVVLHSMRPENFEAQVDKLRLAANEEIKNFDLPRVVELTMRATGVTGDEKKNSILASLASGNEGAGLTKWGLINSFTRAAQSDEVDYESSVELERAGGAILELPASQWQTIAAA